MPKLVAVAKAAKLLDMPRTLLQQLIRQGDLETFEGRVDLEQLKLRFPAVEWEQSPMVERAQIIRNNAYARRIQENLFAPEEQLELQLKRLHVELAVHKTKEAVYRQIIVDLMDKLTQLQQTENYKGIAQELNSWLLNEFRQGNKES